LRKEVIGVNSKFQLHYLFDKKETRIKAIRTASNFNDVLVLPIISATGEKVIQLSKNRIEIHKIKG